MASTAPDPSVSIVVAMARNRVIGRGNELPWRLPGDLRYFKQLTMGKPIIMGRLTHESIGRALPGRRNLVVSRRQLAVAEGCECHPTLEAAIASCAGEPEAMVVGGSQIYALAMALCTKLYLTFVDADVDGDRLFPVFDEAEWALVQTTPGDGKAELPHEFRVYERVQTG